MRIIKFRQKVQFRQKLSSKRMYFLCQQLSFAMESGMSLPMALQLANEALRHGASRVFLQDLLYGMEQGRTLSQALEHTEIGYPAVFLEFVLSGEQNGTMTEALHQAAVYFEQQEKTKQLLISALCYPMILLCLMVIAFGAMLLFVVPSIVETYQNVNAELPKMTQYLLAMGDWCKAYWPMLLTAGLSIVLLGVCFGRRALQFPHIRQIAKRLLLRVPVLGSMYQQYWFLQLSQGLGLMLSSGMLLVNGLEAIVQIYGRSLFSDELERLTRWIQAGHTWADGIAQCSFIPNLAMQMLAISEQSGTLPNALLQLHDYYQQQFQQKLHLVMSILEPCMIILMGIGVLAVGGSLFLPLVQSYQYLL